MIKLGSFLFLLMLLSSCMTAKELQWKKHIAYEGNAVTSAQAFDINGDKKLDVIGSSGKDYWITLSPDYKKKQIIYSFKQKYAKAIHSCIMDVDGDGDMDFVGSSRHIFWLEQPDKDPLTTPWTYHLISEELNSAHCVYVYDVNNDGKKDLVANNFRADGPYADSIVWMDLPKDPRKKEDWKIYKLADGDAPGGSHYFAMADINGDGRDDLACGAKGEPFKNGNWFAVWYAPKDRTKPWKKEMVAENQDRATNIVPAHIDNDGKMDLVATRGHGKGIIWFKKGPSGWKEHMIDPIMAGAHDLAVADVDNDGDMDLTACGYQSKVLAVYYNDGKGNFTKQILVTNQESYDIYFIDMDNDGDLDILNAGRGSKNVIWLEQL